tara:strand:- start:22 stop:402 length:381 start_codon:yes stop_codon:yes gene_type:complete
MKIVKTSKAPAAIGPYSQAVICNGFIFTSGQIAINPETGALVDNNIKSEIAQVIQNLDKILIEAGSSLSKIVKLNVYLKNLDDFPILNSVFEKTFKEDHYPARSTFEVSNLPKNVNIEIDAVAELE